MQHALTGARRWFAALLVTVVALLAFVALDATPAAASYFDCPSGQAGVFRDANGGNGTISPGHDCIAFSTHPVGQCFGFVSSFDDVASSVNVTFGGNHGLYLYDDGFCHTGPSLYIPPHSRADNLAGFYWVFPATWNDRASSFSVS